MDTLADNTAARRALRVYLAHAATALPAATYEMLEGFADSPSVVDAVSRSAELLYARRDELDDAGRTIVAQLASFAATFGFHGMADGNRGGLIFQAMRRDMGDSVEPGQPAPQPPEDDPLAIGAYIVPADAEPIPDTNG